MPREGGPVTLGAVDALVLLAIAAGLAMDAFAVAVAIGAMLRDVDVRQTFRLAFHFGLFQALMPVLGWSAGLSVQGRLGSWDHWIAFGLLAVIGSRAVVNALGSTGEPAAVPDPTRGGTLVALSVATSIDALAVGLTFAVLEVTILYPALVIGLVAAAFTFAGLRIGARAGARLGRNVEVAGGLILIAIGVKILLEHLV